MRFKLILILSILLIFGNTATAEELHIIVSGKANHYPDQKFNEDNSGWGFEYDFDKRGNWIPFVTGASFLDSNRQTSKYLGAGAKQRYRLGWGFSDFHLDAGVFAFLTRRHDIKNNDPFLAALPFISLGNSWTAINMTYVPKIGPNSIAFTYYQISFKLVAF